MDFEQPKDCPFCGGGIEVEVCENSFLSFWIRCGRCHAAGPKVRPKGLTMAAFDEAEREAVRVWNTREGSDG